MVNEGNAAASSSRQKLGGYDFYRSIGSPKYVVAPMVDQSELAWRMLSRAPLPPDMAGPSTEITAPGGRTYTRHQGGAHLCYTPMIHAKVFVAGGSGRGGDGQFNLDTDEEGSPETLAGIEGGDRPLFVQFCANDAEVLLAAAKKVEAHCDAVDINFGCPQNIARRGRYGAFLQDEWELIHSLISTLHKNLSIPVTAKFRIHADLDRTIAYAKMMEAAGAQILTCHGRTREQKGQLTGLADWEMIRKVKEAVSIPVFANGNILYAEDVERCLEVTGCDGVMTAEGNLSNPAIFVPPDHPHAHPPITVLAHRYLDIVDSLKTPTASSAVKGHLFRILKPALDLDPSERLRAKIGGCNLSRGVGDLREIVKEIEELVAEERKADGPAWKAPPIDAATGYRKLPNWASQPYIRPIPVSAEGDPEDPVDGEKTNGAATAIASTTGDGEKTGTSTPKPDGRCANTSCGSIAAQRCPHGLCLVHCRARVAVARGEDAETAEKKAMRGELIGEGCEAHEEKVRNKAAQVAEKRKRKAELRERWRAKKKRKDEEKGAVAVTSSPAADEEEEEQLAANGVAAGTGKASVAVS